MAKRQQTIFRKTKDPHVTGGGYKQKKKNLQSKPEFNIFPANLEDGPIDGQQPGHVKGNTPGSSPVGKGPNWLLEVHVVHDSSCTGTTDGLQ